MKKEDIVTEIVNSNGARMHEWTVWDITKQKYPEVFGTPKSVARALKRAWKANRIAKVDSGVYAPV